jgi:predicted anti-sigma-YlaC factor YlaD
MNCEQYQQLISADLDAELSADEEPGLWEHLAQCAECRRWRHDQLAIRNEFQRWPEESLPSMSAELALPPSRAKGKVYRIPRALAWAAVIVLLIQGVFVTSAIVRAPNTSEPLLALSEEETVETIVLTVKDRVSFSTTENPLMIGRPLTNPDENGG